MAGAQLATPLQGQLFTLTSMQRLNMWQYDRIDPAEVQTLKDETSQSKKEAAEALEKLSEKETALEDSKKRVRQSFVCKILF